MNESLYDRNLQKTLKYANVTILAHIPVFYAMASYFGTEHSIAIAAPLLLLIGQILITKITKSYFIGSILMGFSILALSGTMIHLGKGMIEWHFHIFVSIGILSLFANPWTIISAAATAAVHHVAFYFLLPTSIFNYKASIGIVAIHALFVVAEAIACTFLAYKFKKVLELQNQINTDIGPLIASIDNASKVSSDSCNDLLVNSDSNSSAITQISSTAEEISQMVASTKTQIANVIKNMTQTKESVNQSSEAIAQGDEFIKSLNSIKENMQKLQELSSQQLSSVVESVNIISDKTQIINDIVFQTKLLSFNASVEAARAGEHGKGFSVVAEEIGNLASTSGQASEEINEIVNRSKIQLNESVESVGDNLTKFQGDLESAFNIWKNVNDKLRNSFKEVETNSNQQESSLQQISSASDQQSIGVRELSDALSSIDESSHKNLAQIRNVESITKQLKSDSEKLNKMQESLAGDDKKAA